jgi:hypothetical protein
MLDKLAHHGHGSLELLANTRERAREARATVARLAPQRGRQHGAHLRRRRAACARPAFAAGLRHTAWLRRGCARLTDRPGRLLPPCGACLAALPHSPSAPAPAHAGVACCARTSGARTARIAPPRTCHARPRRRPPRRRRRAAPERARGAGLGEGCLCARRSGPRRARRPRLPPAARPPPPRCRAQGPGRPQGRPAPAAAPRRPRHVRAPARQHAVSAAPRPTGWATQLLQRARQDVAHLGGRRSADKSRPL